MDGKVSERNNALPRHAALNEETLNGASSRLTRCSSWSGLRSLSVTNSPGANLPMLGQLKATPERVPEVDELSAEVRSLLCDPSEQAMVAA